MAALRVVVAGGGVAALEGVLALDALARGRVTVELLAPAGAFVQRPASVLSPFSGVPAPQVPLDRLSEIGVVPYRGSLASVDAAARIVRTTDGGRRHYDRLLVATGARLLDGVEGAVTFRGPISAGAVESALRRARARVIFVAPAESGWNLPLYELALLGARELAGRGVEVLVATAEARPLELFGPVAADALLRVLTDAGVGFVGEAAAVEFLGGSLVLEDGREFGADVVISLPTVRGPALPGLPADPHGFIPVDANARVRGVDDVFAAGDVTSEPVKQGGLAAQQADAAAEAIAADAGSGRIPRPFRRVLRGVVLTGGRPLYLRRDLDEAEGVIRPLRGAPPDVSRDQLWWPAGKIAGRYLTGFLAAGGAPGAVLSERGPDAGD